MALARPSTASAVASLPTPPATRRRSPSCWQCCRERRRRREMRTPCKMGLSRGLSLKFPARVRRVRTECLVAGVGITRLASAGRRFAPTTRRRSVTPTSVSVSSAPQACGKVLWCRQADSPSFHVFCRLCDAGLWYNTRIVAFMNGIP